MSPEGKSLKESYQWQAKSQYRGKLIVTSLSLEVMIYFGTKRKSDIDNFSKILFDSLTGVIWEDDSQIEELLIKKSYDKTNPRIEVIIYEFI